jgi:phage shock protein PspC (stress-responsive transcriptional regulator)
MNKTVTINISGILFHIEEDAYDNLAKYLGSIRSYFSMTEGGTDIMSDIEARIAELLQEKITPSKQVLVFADVEDVKAVMGKPEDFGDGEAQEQKTSGPQATSATYEKVRRRLYRNPDDRAIGGVCGGLAAYFDIDVVWVRLIMFLLIFFGGLSLWVYIIMWIIIPEAKTTAEKFAMRGESANINSILRSFKEEAEDVKNRFTKYGSETSRNYGEAIRSNVGDALRTVFSIIARLIGLILVLIGAGCLIGFVVALCGLSIAGANSDISAWVSAFFTSSSTYAFAVISFILVVGIPVFMLLYGGIKMLFRIRYSNRWMNMTLGFLWLLGVIMGAYIGVSTAQQFSEHARLKQIHAVSMRSDTLFIRVNPAHNALAPYNFDNFDDVNDELRGNNNYRFGRRGKNVQIIGMPQFDVTESVADSAEMLVTYSSKGPDEEQANMNAKSISYKFRQENNDLILDEVFTVKENVTMRFPEVSIKLMIPVGTVVYFDKSIKYMLDDIENTTNTWDGDMVGRRWKMTEKGLTCIDCEDLQTIEEFIEEEHHTGRHQHKHEVQINKDGIKVNGKDAAIRIDKKGVVINTEAERIVVDSNGVSTRTKH